MFSETIELRGHIIDSLILPKVLDEILKGGGNFKIAQVKIGQQRADQSFARIEVSAESSDALDDLILRLRQHGAEVAEKGDAQLAAAPADGIFPNDYKNRLEKFRRPARPRVARRLSPPPPLHVAANAESDRRAHHSIPPTLQCAQNFDRRAVVRF